MQVKSWVSGCMPWYLHTNLYLRLQIYFIRSARKWNTPNNSLKQRFGETVWIELGDVIQFLADSNELYR